MQLLHTLYSKTMVETWAQGLAANGETAPTAGTMQKSSATRNRYARAQGTETNAIRRCVSVLELLGLRQTTWIMIIGRESRVYILIKNFVCLQCSSCIREKLHSARGRSKLRNQNVHIHCMNIYGIVCVFVQNDSMRVPNFVAHFEFCISKNEGCVCVYGKRDRCRSRCLRKCNSVSYFPWVSCNA